MAGNPALARTAEDGSRFYPWKGERFWSVTTIISGGVPKFLERHYAKMTGEIALEAILSRGPYARATAIINRLAASGRMDVEERQARGELTSIKLAKLSKRDLALRWVKGAAERHRDAAAARGIDVHDEAEAHVLRLALDASASILTDGRDSFAWPEALAGYHASFEAWLADWHPFYLATEATVFNRPQAYAGTLDAIVQIEAGALITALDRLGVPIPAWLAAFPLMALVTLVLDYKAGNQVCPEVAMQDAAYARGEFIGLKDGYTEAPLPTIHGGLVLHLTPKGYHLKLVDIGDHVYDAFRFAREVYRFRTQIAPTVLSRDLAPKREKVAA